MKNILMIILLGACSFTSYTQEVEKDLVWLTSINQAETISMEEDKSILLDFTGSDWCSHCKRIEKELFETEEFKKFAQEKLVLVKADFPMKRANKSLQSKELVAHNEALAEKYNPNGVFPSVIILKDGKIIGRLSYPQNSTEEYLDELQGFVK